MTQREIIKIAVEPDAKQAIDAACQRYGMSQIELASRMYRWFARQDETVQASILDLLPSALAPDVAKLVLQRLAAEADEPQPARRAAKRAEDNVHVTRKAPPADPSPRPRPRKS